MKSAVSMSEAHIPWVTSSALKSVSIGMTTVKPAFFPLHVPITLLRQLLSGQFAANLINTIRNAKNPQKKSCPCWVHEGKGDAGFHL